jgi:hypothetical protein
MQIQHLRILDTGLFLLAFFLPGKSNAQVKTTY